MKKHVLFLFLLVSLFGNAQVNLFKQIKDAITLENPKINFDDKLVALNVWQANDIESREANKEFDKMYKIYEFAKLKGGIKGVVIAQLNVTDETASIILNKDGVVKLIPIKMDVTELKNRKNLVFSSNGDLVYENLQSQNIFKSFLNLITR